MKRIFNILIADKNKNVREFLRRELSAEGYEVSVAEDGSQILEKLKLDSNVHLLVFDLEMPNADTSGIFEKARSRQPPLPIVVHTFLTEEHERDSGCDTGDIFIEKSGNIDHLKAAIADTLERFYIVT
jgi:DNA-binding response OmpR family regulator